MTAIVLFLGIRLTAKSDKSEVETDPNSTEKATDKVSTAQSSELKTASLYSKSYDEIK